MPRLMRDVVSIPACLRLVHGREYYFSPRNLRNDWYLRQRMDAHGFVYLTVVANFNRVKELTAAAPRVGAGAPLDVVLRAARASPALELTDGARADSRTTMVRGVLLLLVVCVCTGRGGAMTVR